MQKPTNLNFEALKQTLSYVSCTAGKGIVLQGSNKLNLQAFSDSDWASCVDTRKSIIGYIVILGQFPVIWNQGNNLPFPYRALKLNIRLWPPLLQKLLGLLIYLLILESPTYNFLPYTVIINYQ